MAAEHVGAEARPGEVAVGGPVDRPWARRSSPQQWKSAGQRTGQRAEHLGAEAGGMHEQQVVPRAAEVVDGDAESVGRRAPSPARGDGRRGRWSPA